MHLKVLVLSVFLVCSISSTSSRFELISNSNSKDDYKEFVGGIDSKIQRSGYPHNHPLAFHNRPYNDNGGFTGLTYPQTPLISANVHLLEPFLLVTFLLFVLSLLEKARFVSMASRRDVFKATTMKLAHDMMPSYYYRGDHQKMSETHNDTDAYIKKNEFY